MEEAILEKDILQFRQTLKQVAKSVEPQHSVEEIDDYLNGEMSGAELLEFESDLLQDRSLKDEVKLQRDIDDSIEETDIMELRGQISNILQTETSWNVSEKHIEDFINGELEGKELEEFTAEYNDNTDLMAEVELRKSVNKAISEKDIFKLRKELVAARESADTKRVKMLIPESKSTNMKFWRNSVAVIVVLLGITGVLRNSFVSMDNTYENYYKTPSWSPDRSLSSEVSILQSANISYLEADYDNVIDVLSQVSDSETDYAVFDFYRAASFQNLENYKSAAENYTKVIENGDNLYVEEAEWYRSLCYLKLGEMDKAKNELLAVIERKGHFENDAKAVIRRLKYSKK